MGVMACDRKDCDSIMCGRLSDKYGYICEDCFQELLELPEPICVDDFMNSSKLTEITTRSELRSEFSLV